MKSISCLVCLLLVAAGLAAQAALPTSAAATSLSAVSAPAVGTAFRVDRTFGGSALTAVVLTTTQPTALTLNVEGSIDGTHYFALAVIDATDAQWVSSTGEMVHIVNKQVIYVRCNLVTYTNNAGTASCLLLGSGR